MATKRSCIVTKAIFCICFCTQSINFDRQNFSILNKKSFFSHVISFDQKNFFYSPRWYPRRNPRRHLAGTTPVLS